MITIQGDALRLLIPLLRKETVDFPITMGVLDGTFSGYAVIDNILSPSKAMVFHRHIGFAQYLGDSPDDIETIELASYALKYKSDRKYCNWIEIARCPESVANLVALKIKDIKRYYRISWNHDPEKWKSMPDPILPVGFNIKMLDKSHFKNKFVRRETEMFWDSSDVFLKKAIGTIALDEKGKFMGVCGAVSDSDGFYEVNIEVAENHRRKGIGFAIAHRYISECYNLGKKPHWDCFAHNLPSQALAKKLGFTEAGRYPLVSWTY